MTYIIRAFLIFFSKEQNQHFSSKIYRKMFSLHAIKKFVFNIGFTMLRRKLYVPNVTRINTKIHEIANIGGSKV